MTRRVLGVNRGTASTPRPLVAAIAACCLPALLAATATPASAARAQVEHVVEEYTVTHVAGPEDICGGLPFDVVEHVELRSVTVGASRGPDGFWYSGSSFRGTSSFTNPLNGNEYRQEFAGSIRDRIITDNGDGTLTVQQQGTGPNRYYVNGRLLFMDAGMNRISWLIDHGGTPDDPSDDEFLDFLGVDKDVGLRQAQDHDFCADLVEFLG